MLQTLQCETCRKDWTRELVRGQKPKRCPVCKAGNETPAVSAASVLAGVQDALSRAFNPTPVAVPQATKERAVEATNGYERSEYRVRFGDNLYIGGRFTLAEARQKARELLADEPPTTEGGMRLYVIRETIVESLP